MTVTLELSPAQERALHTEARREGLAVEQCILRRLTNPPQDAPPIDATFTQMQARVAEGFAASGMTQEELDEYVVQPVKKIRAETDPNPA